MAFEGESASEAVRCKITIYPQVDPVLNNRSLDPIVLDGTTRDEGGSLVSCSTTKNFNNFAGNFNFTFKPGDRTVNDWEEQLIDDDWVRIEFTRNGNSYFTMEGFVDSARPTKQVKGVGVISNSVTVTGRDLGKMFDVNPIYFTQYASRFVNFMGQGMQNILGSLPVGTPTEIVTQIAQLFLKNAQTQFGTAWTVPPNYFTDGGRNGIDLVNFDDYMESTQGFRANEAALNASNNTSLGSVMREWSNAALNELFYDLRLPKNYTNPIDVRVDPNLNFGATAKGLRHALNMREKPFPYTLKAGEPAPSGTNLPGNFGSWFVRGQSAIQQVNLYMQDVQHNDTGRSGHERFNMHILNGEHQSAFNSTDHTQLGILMETEAFKIHGLRRLEERTNYILNPSRSSGSLASVQRQWNTLLRGWNSLNPYFYNGVLNLRRMAPEVRMGYRLNLLDEKQTLRQQFYVQGVTHDWTADKLKGRTRLEVTRGWRGDDADLLGALKRSLEGYKENIDLPTQAVLDGIA